MLMFDVDLKPYSQTLYHNEELKSLTRYRFDQVSVRPKLKLSVSRLVTILFPELEGLVSTLHGKAVYALLTGFPSASYIANANLTHLTSLLQKNSKGHYSKEVAEQIRNTARRSIGSVMPAKSLELKHTISMIRMMDDEIAEIEAEIKKIMDKLNPPLLTIPGIGLKMGAMILAEVGDFSAFNSANMVLAYADVLRLYTSQDSLLQPMLKWKSGDRNICVCSDQCCQEGLPLGQDFPCVSYQEESGRKTFNLSCCSHCQEIDAADLSPANYGRVFCSGTLISILFGA